MKLTEDMTPEERDSMRIAIKDYGFTLKHTMPKSLILIAPVIRDLDGTEHRPKVDIFWNEDIKQIDVKYTGGVSDAAKLLCDQFAAQMWEFFKERIAERETASRD
jgi:hypothetical protein